MKNKGIIILLFLSFISISMVDTGEYNAKLAYLHRFTRFVTWPEGDLKEKQEFVIGIAGSDPFGKTLETLIKTKTIKGKKIIKKELKNISEIEGVDLLFIPEKHLFSLEDILIKTGGLKVLTISEKKGYLKQGVMMNLNLVYGELKFGLNKKVIDKEGFVVNSKLYQIAEKVIK